MIKWYGDKVKEKGHRAIEKGMNMTMEQCVTYAKQNHPWVYRTGKLERSIKIKEFAKQVGSVFVGLWGSVGVKYALPLELGLGRLTRAYPFLRPSADANYKNLGKNIKRAFK